jgi:hypothetical protein
MPTNQTIAVSVTFTLYSSTPNPPYDVAGCQGTISYNNNAPAGTFNGWNAVNMGTPQPSGAAFTLMVADSSYSSSSNVTGVANWALTFIPRAGTSQQSPFGNNQNTITGSGATNNNGVFTLNLGNAKIKNAGDWDWSLMIQMTMPGGTVVKCFSSDPEMEVGS